MKEHIKTLILVLLGVSALYLAWRTWVADSAVLFDMDRAEPEQVAPARLDVARAAPAPAKCAVMRSGERTGAQYGTETEEVYDAFRLLLAEAFGSAGEAAVLDSAALQDALFHDSVYFEFSRKIPLPLLAAWLSSESPADTVIEAVGLSFTPGGEVRLIWVGTDGVSTITSTGAALRQWPELPELQPCAFVFETEYAAGLHPMQLLIEENHPRPNITVSAPPDLPDDLSSLAQFMDKLELPLTGTPYHLRSGTRVYVNVGSGRSCEISPDGTILFESPVPSVQRYASTLADDVFRAWEAVSLLEPVMGGARLEVGLVTQTDDVTSVEFIMTAGGVPVQWEGAVAEVERGVVRRITLQLYRVSDASGESVPLPLKQAAALVPAGGAARLNIRYITGDSGTAQAVWAVKQ
jgi:hypothetical protein